MFSVLKKKLSLDQSDRTKMLVSKKHFELENIDKTKLLVAKEKYDINVIVNFDKNGGDSISFTLKKYNIAGKYDEFPTTSKTGYRLVRWFDVNSQRTVSLNENVDFRVKNLKAEWEES